jgi:capsule polysaccharide export protein KpsE/RkpR
MSINFEEILSRAPWKFEEQNKFLESVTTIINYFIIIVIIVYYNYIINSKKYISNTGFLKECDKEANLEVSGAASTSV